MLESIYFLTAIPPRVLQLAVLIGIPVSLYLLAQLIRFFPWTKKQFLRIRQKRMQDEIKYDNRPPVLYLRPFAVDGSRETYHGVDFDKFKFKVDLGEVPIVHQHLNFEYTLGVKIEKIGPFVAIGDPEKKSAMEMGAAREFYSNNEWQEQVSKKMNWSSMIIMRSSGELSEGVLWELKQLTTHHLKKSIFLVERHSSILMHELILRLPDWQPEISKIEDSSFPCYVEFLDQGKITISKDISKTSLYRTLYRLSKFNRYYMYCAKCGEANKTENLHCTSCGTDLRVQKIERKKKKFNPMIGFITGDTAFLLIAILLLVSNAMWYWWNKYSNRDVIAQSGYFKTISITSFILNTLLLLILILFTVKVWRQVFILIIAVVLTVYQFQILLQSLQHVY
jgi:hypothetical protein